MDANVFFSDLETLMKQIGVETAIEKGEEFQLGGTLRMMLPVTEAGDKVLMEVMLAQYTEDALLLQIFSTMIAEIGDGYDTLRDIILDWNHTCPLGAFGIYRKERQFYHKYNCLLPTDDNPSHMALEVFYFIHLVGDVIGEVFPEAVRLSGNSLPIRIQKSEIGK